MSTNATGRCARLTVKPSGSLGSSSVRPRLSRMKLSRHSAQKSSLTRELNSSNGECGAYSFWPSSCFCSSVRRYLVWVTSNLPAPRRVTRQTRRFVPPRSSARYSPCSSPVGHWASATGLAEVRVHARQRRRWELRVRNTSRLFSRKAYSLAVESKGRKSGQLRFTGFAASLPRPLHPSSIPCPASPQTHARSFAFVAA